VKLRETYKAPLRAAYDRQSGKAGQDCQAESNNGQQPYNICMGRVADEAEKDFDVFYSNLQMLCHDRNQLSTLQDSQKNWLAYKDSALKAARALWPEGSGAPGFLAEVHLRLVRYHMRELNETYALNIAQ